RLAWRCAQTAAGDASYGKAQAIMLDKLFKDDQLDQAESFAANLIHHPPASENDGTDYTNYFLGARYVLARSALHAMVPRPDEALKHLRLSRQLQNSSEEPRWRMIALEAQAL